MTGEPTDEDFARSSERVNRIERREAAWERYRDTVPMRRVLESPEPGDVRLAFEAGYRAALGETRAGEWENHPAWDGSPYPGEPPEKAR